MPDPQPPAPPSMLDQYKSYLTDVGNIGTRYTTTNSLYVSVITALLGILAFAKAGETLASTGAYLGLAVSGFAILVCVAWSRSIVAYRNLFRTKFLVLQEMEQQGNLFPIFSREDKLREGRSLLQNDALIPRLLSAPFLVAFILFAFRLFKSH